MKLIAALAVLLLWGGTSTSVHSRGTGSWEAIESSATPTLESLGFERG